jgi:ubiquinone/menaquinone biosynthesis C-methylase UbiE
MKIEQSSGTPPPIEKQIAFYDQWNVAQRSFGFEQADEDSRARGEAVLAEIGRLGLVGPSILEIGCGTGWLTERLASHGTCHGIDLSPRSIEVARTRGLEATFEAGDFLALPAPPNASTSRSSSRRSSTSTTSDDSWRRSPSGSGHEGTSS